MEDRISEGKCYSSPIYIKMWILPDHYEKIINDKNIYF